MKKQLFIYSYNLELGGVERSLLGLLEALNPEEYDVDLFLAKQEGELLSLIPQHIHLLPVDKHYQAFGIPLMQAFREGYCIEAILRFFAKLENKTVQILYRDSRLALEGFFFHHSIIRMMKKQHKKYDIAISFTVPYDYVLTKVKARQKIGWIHTDYKHVHIDCSMVRRMFKKINRIACVSESVRLNLLDSMPLIKAEKTFVFENILSTGMLKSLAMEKVYDFPNDGSIRLLSVGRFCEAKNFDNVPEICKLIRKTGLNVKWYLIGFGGYEELIRQKIAEFGMQEYVIILGKKANPYPYMANCDLYVQPSCFEGKAVTVREAQALGKPVVITNFPTAPSQLRDGFDGVIVPMDNKGCAEGIKNVLGNYVFMNLLSLNCKKTDYSNSDEIRKLI